MHDAFSFASLVDKLPLSILCLETYANGTKLLVGTTEGVLLEYNIVPGQSPSEPFTVNLNASKRAFSRKPIEQLQAVEDLDLLLSLSDGVVSIHDLTTLNPRSQMAKTKGANLFVLDSPPPAKATVSPPVARSSQAGRATSPPSAQPTYRLCVSARKKLLFFEWANNDFVDGKEISVADKARTIVFHNDKLCVGINKDYFIVNISTGAMTEMFGVKQGKHIAAKLPKNEILVSRDSVSVFVNAEDGKPTRKYGITWSEVPETYGYCFPYVVGIVPKGIEVRTIETQSLIQQITALSKAKVMTQGNVVYVASTNSIWRLVPVSLATQVDQLVDEKEFEEAINLLDQVTDMNPRQREEKLRNVRRLYAYHLFAKRNYDRAITLFQELNADPVEVIGLFPSLSPDLRMTFTPPIKLPRIEGQDLEKALGALIKFLTDRRSMIAKLSKQDDESYEAEHNPQFASSMAGDLDEFGGGSTVGKRPSTVIKQLDDAPPMSTSLREMAQVIDTTLLKAYLATNSSLVGPLLRLPNQCNLAESVQLLNQHKKYSELVELYYGKELHAEALQLLAKFGQTPGGPLSGPSHTVAYLQRLNGEHVDMILQFSTWVLKADLEEGFRIFSEDYPGYEKLPRDTILNHLFQTAPTLTVRYLEHIVLFRHDPTPEFHNQLLFFYIDAVKNELSSTGPQETASEERKKLIKLLDSSSSYAAEKILPRLPESALHERAILLARLGQHDAALTIYAYKMRSFNLAEEYCKKNYDPEKEDSRDVYLSLLRVYLKPEPSSGAPSTPLIEPALELLSKHYTKLDPAKALELLPPSLHISEIFPFILAVLQEDSKLKHGNQVVKNLLKSEHLQIQEQLIHYRSRRIRVDKDTMCPVCTKRIGNSAFASFPNGQVVHYICAKDRPQLQ